MGYVLIGQMGYTAEGGAFRYMVNKTGAPSVKGSVVQPYKGVTVTTNAFQLCAAPYYDPVGIVYDEGIADGELSGGGVTELQEHFKEIGHAWETVAAGGAGTYQLCFCELHFC